MDFSTSGKSYAAIWRDMLPGAIPIRVAENHSPIYLFRDRLYYGYDWGFNTSAQESVCRDKYLTYQLLQEAGIPVIPSYLFIGYNRTTYQRSKEIISLLTDLIKQYKGLVLKPNTGSGGRNVVKIKDIGDPKIYKILGGTFIASPFVEVTQEYRLIFLDQTLLLCLVKKPLYIVGDGHSTVQTLMENILDSLPPWCRRKDIAEEIHQAIHNHDLTPTTILPLGSTYQITWRLNQSMGAVTTKIVEPPPEILNIGLSAMKALHMRFAAVDISQLVNGSFSIMELNTKVMEDLMHYGDEKILQEVTLQIPAYTYQDVSCTEPLVKLPSIRCSGSLTTPSYQASAQRYRKILSSPTVAEQPIKWYSEDYLAIVNKRYIINGDYSLNSTTACHLCWDKTATSAVLEFYGIPNAPHFLVTSDTPQQHVVLAEKMSQYPRGLVVKSLYGSHGDNMYTVQHPLDIEKVLSKFAGHNYAVSPYFDIIDEYRVIMTDYGSTPILIYRKIRAAVIGDGIHSLMELVWRDVPNYFKEFVSKTSMDKLHSIPSINQTVILSWQHNLDRGASPVAVDNAELTTSLTKLGCQAMRALQLCYGAVDIISTNEGLMVLEVNSTPGYGRFMDYYGDDKFAEVVQKIIKSGPSTIS